MHPFNQNPPKRMRGQGSRSMVRIDGDLQNKNPNSPKTIFKGMGIHHLKSLELPQLQFKELLRYSPSCMVLQKLQTSLKVNVRWGRGARRIDHVSIAKPVLKADLLLMCFSQGSLHSKRRIPEKNWGSTA